MNANVLTDVEKTTRVFLVGDVHTWGVVNVSGSHHVTFTDHCFTCITKESVNDIKLGYGRPFMPHWGNKTHFDTKNNLISSWKRDILIVFYLVCSNSVDLNSQQSHSYFKFGHSRNQIILRNVTTFETAVGKSLFLCDKYCLLVVPSCLSSSWGKQWFSNESQCISNDKRCLSCFTPSFILMILMDI